VDQHRAFDHLATLEREAVCELPDEVVGDARRFARPAFGIEDGDRGEHGVALHDELVGDETGDLLRAEEELFLNLAHGFAHRPAGERVAA
jgi:hypothetical protein